MLPRPPYTAVCREPLIAVAYEVGEQLVVGTVHDRALGDVDHEVLAAHAVLRFPEPWVPDPALRCG